jgi:hypothetical protein
MGVTDFGPRKELLSPRERAFRGGTLLFIAALHVVFILWLATQSLREQRKSEGAISLITVATPASSGSEPETPRVAEVETKADNPIVIARLPLPALDAAPSAPGSSASEGSGATAAGGCQLAEAVGAAILTDGAAMAELDALPPQARTQADAVMLWDGRWQQSASAVPPHSAAPANGPILTLSQLRRVVEQEIHKAETECRDAIVNGPRFIALPGARRTIIIVVGSGQWRWGDLLRPDQAFEPLTRDPPAPPAPSKNAD